MSAPPYATVDDLRSVGITAADLQARWDALVCRMRAGFDPAFVPFLGCPGLTRAVALLYIGAVPS